MSFFPYQTSYSYVNHVSLLYGEITAKNRLMQMTMLDLGVADDISLSTIKDGYNQQRNLGLAAICFIPIGSYLHQSKK